MKLKSRRRVEARLEQQKVDRFCYLSLEKVRGFSVRFEWLECHPQAVGLELRQKKAKLDAIDGRPWSLVILLENSFKIMIKMQSLSRSPSDREP